MPIIFVCLKHSQNVSINISKPSLIFFFLLYIIVFEMQILIKLITEIQNFFRDYIQIQRRKVSLVGTLKKLFVAITEG